MKQYIGLDIGGTSIKHGLVTEDGKIITKGVTKTAIDGEDILNSITEIVTEYQQTATISGVGVSAPGIVQANGYMTTGGAIRDFYGINLKDAIESRIKIPTVIENDANAAAFAELWRGSAQGLHSYFCMVIGTGIGGGIVINDQIYRGGQGMAGELGMMAVVDRGITHDLEYDSLNYTGATVGGLLRYYNDHHTGEDLDDAKRVYELANSGDQLAQASLNFFYTALATGIINLIVALDPEKVLLGGGISANKQFISELNAKVNDLKQANNDLRNLVFPEIVAAQLKNDAGIIGAAYRAVQSNK